MEKYVEGVFLVAACSALLWVSLGDMWGHRIHHEFPYSYLATDPFQHQTRAQWIKDAGNYRFEAPYYSSGLSDVVGFYPPVLNHLAVVLSHLSGQEVHDVIMLIPVLAAVATVLFMFVLLKQVSRSLAMLSLPFSAYIFYIKESAVAFFWGHWPAVVGDMFLVFTCAAITQLHRPRWWILVSLLLVGTVYAHTASFVFAMMFFGLWLAYTWVLERQKFPRIKEVVMVGAVVGLASAYFLNLFRQSWMIVHPFTLAPVTEWLAGGGFVQFSHFGYAQYLVLAGIPLAFLLARKHAPLLLSLFILGVGLTNYVGFTIRAFNVRFFWPIVLAPLFALPLHYLLKTVTKHVVVAAVIAIVLFAGITNANYKRAVDQAGFMNTYVWDTLMWLRSNTPPESTVYFGYGDLYEQDAGLGNARRVFSRTQAPELIPLWQQKNISRYIPIKLFSEAGAGLPHSVGLFSYGLYLKEQPGLTLTTTLRDVCAYDFYVFDRVSQYPELLNFSLQFAERMVRSGHFRVAHDNQWSVVLQNSRPGEECIGAA
ncbi:hypothetical protein HY490_04875 [Candidatus Woesearchaeota archaeon]|nr:hypothetical protein [Candidatus Woesearchaeota archaeon]